MRRRIAWLVGATTSAVVLAFVIPLCLLVRTVAEDRAMATASQEARNVAILVSGLHTDPQLPGLVAAVDDRSSPTTSVLTPDGQVLGAAVPGLTEDPAVQRARAGEAFTEVGDEGRVLVPVVTEDGTYVVRTAVSGSALHSGVGRAWAGIIGLGALLLLVALVIADRLGRRVSTPVTDLAAVAHRLRDGDLDARARPEGPPETVELGQALNRLADRITELLAAERATVGDLSHRLRTPVTALRLDSESVPDAELAGRLQDHIAALQRTIDAVVRDARRPLRNSMGSTCDASVVVAERCAFWAALAEDQGRRFHLEMATAPLVVGIDGTDLTDLVDVLLDNVFAHTPDDVGFSVRLHERDGRAVLEVVDRGPGMPAVPPAERRTGTSGLGLQIVRRTVAGIGGELTVSSRPGRGTAVVLALPLADAAVPGRPSAAHQAHEAHLGAQSSS